MNIKPNLLLFLFLVTFLPLDLVGAETIETASKFHLLTGELVAVDVKQSILTIKCLVNDKERSYREEVFRADPFTRITRFGEPVMLSQLQIGSQAAFTYSEACGTEKILRTLQVKD